MKKIIIALVLSIAFITSASAFSIGLRGDANFGIMNSAESTIDLKNSMGGSIGLWSDLPFINFKVLSVGVRPDLDIAFNKVKIDDASITTTDFDIDLFLSLSVNLSSLRISLGVGPTISWSFNPVQKSGKNTGITYTMLKTNWQNPTWGLGAFVQAGVKLGPGYLLGDVRFGAPFSDDEFIDIKNGGDTIKTKSYKIDVGIGYEFIIK